MSSFVVQTVLRHTDGLAVDPNARFIIETTEGSYIGRADYRAYPSVGLCLHREYWPAEIHEAAKSLLVTVENDGYSHPDINAVVAWLVGVPTVGGTVQVHLKWGVKFGTTLTLPGTITSFATD